MTLGYEIITAIDRRSQARNASAVRAEAELLVRVTSEDRRGYDGVSYSAGDVGRNVLTIQRDKSRAVGDTVSSGARQLRDRVEFRLQSEAEDPGGLSSGDAPGTGTPPSCPSLTPSLGQGCALTPQNGRELPQTGGAAAGASVPAPGATAR